MSSTLQLQIDPKMENASMHIRYGEPPIVVNGDVDGDWDERKTNAEGYVAFMFVDHLPVYVLVRALGFQDALVGPIQMPHDDLVEVPLVRVPGGLARLTVDRWGFRTGHGRVFIKGVSAFMHYEKMLRGENLTDRLDQVQQLGSNCVRVFGMAHHIPVNAGRPPFKPQDWPQYFDAQPEFLDLCQRYGQYVYWSVFPDAELIGVSDKRAFFDREVAALKSRTNTFGELTNEQDAHAFNAVNPADMTRPNGLAFCSGSYGDIGGVQPHAWDFCDYHTPRGDWTKHIKDSCVVDHPNYRQQGKGILLGEPDRFGTGGNGDLDLCRLSAGACNQNALGQIFHSAQGRESQLYDAFTAGMAADFFRAME